MSRRSRWRQTRFSSGPVAVDTLSCVLNESIVGSMVNETLEAEDDDRELIMTINIRFSKLIMNKEDDMWKLIITREYLLA